LLAYYYYTTHITAETKKLLRDQICSHW